MVARAASRGTKPPPAAGAAGDLSPEQRVAWYNVIGIFQRKAQEFEAAQAALSRPPAKPLPPELEAERRRLLERSAVVRSTVLRIRGALDDVQAALRGAWGLVTGAWDTARSVVGLNALPELGSLGLAPLIPIALVAAAIATVTVFLADYAKFSRKVELLERGYTPEQIAATDPDRPLLGGFGVTGIVVLIAAALLGPPVFRALQDRRGARS